MRNDGRIRNVAVDEDDDAKALPGGNTRAPSDVIWTDVVTTSHTVARATGEWIFVGLAAYESARTNSARIKPTTPRITRLERRNTIREATAIV